MEIKSNRTIIFALPLFLILFFSFIVLNQDKYDGWSILQVFSAYPTAIFFLISIIVLPIFEEFGFRFFLSDSKNKKVIQVSLLILLALIFRINEYVFFVIFIIGFVVLLSILKSKSYSFTLVIIYSSLVFMILHFGNINQEIVTTVHYLLVIFSFGLLLSLIRIRYGIMYSILIHVIYNGLLLIPGYLSFPKMINEINDKAYVQLNKESLWNYSHFGGYNTYNHDTLIVERKLLMGVIDEFLNNDEKTIYKVQPCLAKYEGKVYFEKNDLKSIGQAFDLNIDTTIQKSERFIISSFAKKSHEAKNHDTTTQKNPAYFSRSSLNHLIHRISKKYNTPIKLDADDEVKKTIVEVSFDPNIQKIELAFKELSDQLPFNFKMEKDSVLTTIYELRY